jgi:hypothetical protein
MKCQKITPSQIMIYNKYDNSVLLMLEWINEMDNSIIATQNGDNDNLFVSFKNTNNINSLVEYININ